MPAHLCLVYTVKHDITLALHHGVHTSLTILGWLGGGVSVEFIKETKNSNSVSPGVLKVDSREPIFGHNEIKGLVKPPGMQANAVSGDTL